MASNKVFNGNMKSFFVSLKARLPGGYLLYDLLWSVMDFRYGLRVIPIRFLYHLAIFCFGGSRIHRCRDIAELKPPYPVLYHFTPKTNVEGITAKGLLSNHGKVWMTDWTDPRWSAWFGNKAIACFQIDTERLIASGHKVAIMERSHEFTTDYVPPDCLSVPIE